MMLEKGQDINCRACKNKKIPARKAFKWCDPEDHTKIYFTHHIMWMAESQEEAVKADHPEAVLMEYFEHGVRA